MNPHYPFLADRAGHRCEYCHAPEDVFNFPLEVEHIVPRSQDGSDDLDNLALSCRACNLYKSSQVKSADLHDGTEYRLFHPRQDSWTEHFSVDVDGATIEGITAIGRATVSCLQMNNAPQVKARRQWIRLGLFP